MKKRTKIIICIAASLFGLLLLTIAVLAIAYNTVSNATKDYIYDDIEKIPARKVGLLLGTNPLGPNGGANYYFTYRIDAAVQLFEAGKIEYILVSGDNHTKSYDEVTCMKDALEERGVPEERIVLDYAGFNTLSSVVRAKEVFEQDSFIIISQKFHNERAVCLARHYDIDAIGFNARDIRKSATNMKFSVVRESFARVKMYLNIWFGKKPRFGKDGSETIIGESAGAESIEAEAEAAGTEDLTTI